MSLFQIGMSLSPRRVLLVVDEDAQVCRLMRRCLGEHFDEIHTASDPVSATDILEKHIVTHLLCEFFLGGAIDGAKLVRFARWEFSSIERAVIFTTGDAREVREEETSPEIDAVVCKAEGIDAIVSALLENDEGER